MNNYPNIQNVVGMQGCGRYVQRFDLELWNTYNDVDFLNALCYKLNECIDVVNLTQEQFKKIVEFVDTMLKTYTQEQLQKWLEDGTMDTIINQQIFGELNTKLDNNIANVTALTTKVDQNMSDISVLKEKTVYLTPQMFGAVGDGITDDISAFEKMIAKALETIPTREFQGEASCKDWSHVTMLFTGSYAISKPITFSNTYGLTINNLNVIAVTATYTGVSMLLLNNVNRNTKITNSSFNCNFNANRCIHIQDYTLTTEISNVELTRFLKYGISTQGKGHELKCINLKVNQVEWGEQPDFPPLITSGTGIYLTSERYDNELSQLVVNYCKSSSLYIEGGSTFVLNSHFYVGNVLNTGGYNTFDNCYFDGSRLSTKGNVSINNCLFLNSGTNVDPFIYLTETADMAWKYETSMMCNNKFVADTQTPVAVEKGRLTTLPNMTTIGNTFYKVTPFITNGLVANAPNPWDTPRDASGNSDSGYARYGDLIYVWGIASNDSFQTYPTGVTLSVTFNVMMSRLDNNNTGIPWANSIQNNRFWANNVGTGSTVKWLVIGRA